MGGLSQGVLVWLVLLVALLAANLPFLTQRVLGVWPLGDRSKSSVVRLAELVILYFVTGGIGLMLERRVGQISPQGWEFYAVTASLFIVLAFPGFTWRYLVKRRARG